MLEKPAEEDTWDPLDKYAKGALRLLFGRNTEQRRQIAAPAAFSQLNAPTRPALTVGVGELLE